MGITRKVVHSLSCEGISEREEACAQERLVRRIESSKALGRDMDGQSGKHVADNRIAVVACGYLGGIAMGEIQHVVELGIVDW